MIAGKVDERGPNFHVAPTRSLGHLRHRLEGRLDRLLARQMAIRMIPVGFGWRNFAFVFMPIISGRRI